MLSANSNNYILTKDGVISKLDTYWDRLREITARLDGLANLMQKKLLNSFIGSFLLFILIFWFKPEENVSLILLMLVVLGTVSLASVQLISFLEFISLQKKGMILYKELNRELDWDYENDYIEEVSVEERILLNNFLLACEMPIHPYLYGFLLALLPLSSIGIFLFYYFGV